MKRFICYYWRGHDYVFGYGRRMGEDTVLSVTLCTYCGARFIVPKEDFLTSGD